jgi:hypothetical protein
MNRSKHRRLVIAAVEHPEPERFRRSRKKPAPSDASSRTTSFGSGIFAKSRRLAIRAAKFEPEADRATWTVSEIHCAGISVVRKTSGH